MKKDEKLDITKEKLISATIKLITDRTENPEVTSREIAKEAGVQLAMINYCFGSREAMLYEAFCRKENEYMSNSNIVRIFNEDISPKEKLRKLHYIVAEFMISHYSYIKVIAGYVLLHRDLSKEPHSLPLIMAHFNGRKSERECRMISYELSSVMQLTIYRCDDIKSYAGYDFTDVKQLHHFIDMQFEFFLED